MVVLLLLKCRVTECYKIRLSSIWGQMQLLKILQARLTLCSTVLLRTIVNHLLVMLRSISAMQLITRKHWNKFSMIRILEGKLPGTWAQIQLMNKSIGKFHHVIMKLTNRIHRESSRTLVKTGCLKISRRFLVGIQILSRRYLIFT